VPKLTILGPDAPERQVELTDRDLRIGRDDQNDIVLPDSSKAVSRSHAELRFENGQYVLFDLNSPNGLWVGGRRLSRIVLEPGVPVLVGSYRLVLEDAPATPDAAPGEPYTVAGGLPAGTPSSSPSLSADPARSRPVGADQRRAASGTGMIASLTLSPKAALFWGVAAVIVLALIVVGLRGRIDKVDHPIVDIPPVVPTPPSNEPTDEERIRTLLSKATDLLASNDPDGALAELDQALQLDPSNTDALDLKIKANDLKNAQLPPPLDPSPTKTPPPAKLPVVVAPPCPPPLVARKAGESPEDWCTRDRQIATRYDRAKAEVDGDFQAAIRDLNSLEVQEPNYKDVRYLLRQAQARAHEAAQKAMDQGTDLEKQGQFPEALQQYRRAQQIDPASNVNESINRVLVHMKADGDAAFDTANRFYTLQKYLQAIPFFEKAVKLLPDVDPDKKTAQDRLNDCKSRQ
jgi:pSer/pThr/pTyr-binding forkhead associated (FHA) protein